MRLDNYDTLPTGISKYLSLYGWHFNKKLCEFAVSKMTKENNTPLQPITKDTLDFLFKKYGISIKNAEGYDCVFVANMCKADYYGSSIINEESMVRFVKDYIDDPDGYEGLPMTRYFADVIGKGVVIDWEDMI